MKKEATVVGEGVKAAFWIFALLVSVICVGMLVLAPAGWLSSSLSLAHYKYFAPKQADAQRQVFENTKSFREGMVQNLYKSQEEYIKADEVQKKALSGIILQRYADVKPEVLPQDLQNFLAQLRSGR